jgi:hypothetical protein
MAGVPPLKGSAYSFEVALVDQADTDFYKTNPTLAAGDVKVSKDGGSFTNIASLPTAIDAGAVLTVALTGTEMTADRVAVLFHDVAGSEWQDLLVQVETDTQQLTSLVDDVWDEVLTAATHNVATSAGRRLRAVGSLVIREETAQGPGTGNNQIQLDAAASAVDGAYDPAIVVIVSGTGVGQSRLVLEYAGATKTATVDRDWKVNPAADSEYQIVADVGREHVNEGLARAGTSTTIRLNALASATDDEYNGQVVFIRSGTGQDQARRISDYDGATQNATVHHAWSTTPDATSGYVMLPTSLIHNGWIGELVWDALLADHDTAATFGKHVADLLTAAQVWQSPIRTLTQSAASVTAAVTGSDISVPRMSTWTIALTGLGDISSRTKLYFTVKDALGDTDATAMVQVEETDGLKYLNGAAATTSTDGSIAIVDAVAGSITITLKAAAANVLSTGDHVYDVKMVTATGVTILTSGKLEITDVVTRAIT